MGINKKLNQLLERHLKLFLGTLFLVISTFLVYLGYQLGQEGNDNSPAPLPSASPRPSLVSSSSSPSPTPKAPKIPPRHCDQHPNVWQYLSEELKEVTHQDGVGESPPLSGAIYRIIPAFFNKPYLPALWSANCEFLAFNLNPVPRGGPVPSRWQPQEKLMGVYLFRADHHDVVQVYTSDSRYLYKIVKWRQGQNGPILIIRKARNLRIDTRELTSEQS